MIVSRRDFLKFAGVGGAVLMMRPDSLAVAAGEHSMQEDFFFVQLSDTHWGFNDPKINPDYQGTLKKAIAYVNSLEPQPDFIVFTGDLTHTTDDPKERRKRMAEFRDIIGELKVKNIKLLPGEHDASLDNGEAFKEFFGKTHYSFDHKGVHFIAIDNVSDPTSSIGDAQLQWLAETLKPLDKESQIVILTHRPLFDLLPKWDWATRDGAKAIELLMPYKNVMVLYGHIHQENMHVSGHIPSYAAKGLMYPLPAPDSLPKKIQLPWDPAEPYKGMGFRSVAKKAGKAKYQEYQLTEYSVINTGGGYR